MSIIGRSEQQAIDRLWQERTGLPMLMLMEAAAAAVSRFCRHLLTDQGKPDASILILAGKGQNGGDAFACARQLKATGFNVICRELYAAADLPPESGANRQAARALGLGLGPPRQEDFDALAPGSLIIDGIFGTGYHTSRTLPPHVAEVCRQIKAARQKGACVISIDVPTGLDADSGAVAPDTVQADFTLTFSRSKIGLCASPGRFTAGKVTVISISVPDNWVEEAIMQVRESTGKPEIRQITAEDVLALCPSRDADGHKGSFGKVLLLAGSAGMPGAAVLAADAAARSGVGLLTVGVPESIGPLVLAARPEAMLQLVPETAGDEETAWLIEKLVVDQQAVAVGPGAGSAAWLKIALPILIAKAEYLLIDADALNLMASNSDQYFPLLRERAEAGLAHPILTPHPGEFRRLAPGISTTDRQLAARQLAELCACVVVLKGASTVVAGPEGPIWINPTGQSGLARGGSGDVLCGLIAGLMAQGLNPRAAALAGVYLHGLAADLAAAKRGRRAMLPVDVIAMLGDAFRATGWEQN